MAVLDRFDADANTVAGVGVGLLIVGLTYNESNYTLTSNLWAAVLFVLVCAAMPSALDSLQATFVHPGVAPGIVVGVLGVIFLCVPETDQVPVALGVPLTVTLIELVARRQLGLPWYGLSAAAVGWAAMFGATGRAGALAGAIVAWLPILLVAVVVHRWPGRAISHLAVVLAAGFIGAAAMARTGGISDSAAVIVSAAALSTLSACGAAWLLVARQNVGTRASRST